MEVSKISGKEIMFPQLRGSLAGMKYPALAEIKYDGEFNYIIKQNGNIFTINKYGTMRKDFPVLRLIDKALKASGAVSAALICEIFWDEGKLGALYDLLSHKKDDAIKLRVFDIIELNGADVRKEELLTRKEYLHASGLKRWLAKSWVVEDKDDVQLRFVGAVDDGYEGIVVKGFDTRFASGPCSWVKLKYKDQNDYAVATIDPTKERISVSVHNPKGIVDVGVKAPNRYKKHISVGTIVTIEHQGVLASGSLRHPVLIPKKEWK